MKNQDFFLALDELEKEKRIKKENFYRHFTDCSRNRLQKAYR